MPPKITAKQKAMRRFYSTGTASGRSQDLERRAETVGLKRYKPQVNDYEGVDTPAGSIKKKKAPKKRAVKRSVGGATWSAMAAAALKEASRKYRAKKR